MSIGYACISIGVPGTGLRTCTKKFATPELLSEIIGSNLRSLERQIDYNVEQGIRLFRISSDIIPFAGTAVNTVNWANDFQESLKRISGKIMAGRIRVSMHPGQYTVINTKDEGVLTRAVDDLTWHAKFLDVLGTPLSSKIVLHIGGVYDDKVEAMRRFVKRFRALDDKIRRRLVIENDERLYTVDDVLQISSEIGVPVVYDNLHHDTKCPHDFRSHADILSACAKTWRLEDGRPKIHYSQQALGKKSGAHADSVSSEAFLAYYREIHGDAFDIMIEGKDKNLSAVKCILLTSGRVPANRLEDQWRRYKYYVMERAPDIYTDIRHSVFSKNPIQAKAFYERLEEAQGREILQGPAENAALHVWGYFKNDATEQEKKRFFSLLLSYRNGQADIDACKRHLFRMAEKYAQSYLLDALYFYI